MVIRKFLILKYLISYSYAQCLSVQQNQNRNSENFLDNGINIYVL